jgi:tight adherence protein B
LSETLENLADVIRKRVALKAKGYAMTAEARSSALVLAAIPILTGAAMWALNPSYIGILLYDRTGNKLLAAAAISLTTGMLIIRFIIRKTLP